MMEKNKILIVDDEAEQREVLETIFSEEGFEVDTVSTGQQALKMMESGHYNLVLSDLIMEEMDGLELLKQVRTHHEDVKVIIITGYGSIETAVSAMKQGASSYFIKGHAPEELLIEVERALQIAKLQHENEILRDTKKDDPSVFTTKNTAFAKVLNIAKKAAKSNVNILLSGESGVGKEVMARFIHANSDRAEGHLMAINCHAFSESLLESELFGHEKGAYTGAYRRRKGRFEAAHGSTLFLDEIGDIPLGTQAKLLRVLETKQIERIGSSKTIDVNFRLVSATNKALESEVRKGTIRSDFYYRISTMPLSIPPLRERKEDIPDLIDFFLSISQIELKKKIRLVESGVRRFLGHYHYPGNIRELKNMIEQLVVLSEDGVIRLQDLPASSGELIGQAEPDEIRPIKEIRRKAETDHIRNALVICNYNMAETARRLRISRRQLFNKMHEYGLR